MQGCHLSAGIVGEVVPSVLLGGQSMVTFMPLQCLSLSEVFDKTMTKLGSSLGDENSKLFKTHPVGREAAPGCILLSLGSHQLSVFEALS